MFAIYPFFSFTLTVFVENFGRASTLFTSGLATIVDFRHVLFLNKQIKTFRAPHWSLRINGPIGDGTLREGTIERNSFATVDTLGFDVVVIARRGVIFFLSGANFAFLGANFAFLGANFAFLGANFAFLGANFVFLHVNNVFLIRKVQHRRTATPDYSRRARTIGNARCSDVRIDRFCVYCV